LKHRILVRFEKRIEKVNELECVMNVLYLYVYIENCYMTFV